MADSAYVKNDLSKLANNTYRKHDADFTGLVLYFTPKGRYIGGYAYSNGSLIAPSSSNQSSAGQTVQSVNAGTAKLTTNELQVCTDWIADYYLNGVYWFSEDLGTTCTSGGGGGSGGSGGSAGSGGTPSTPPPPTCPPSSGGSSDESLIVNVTEPPPGGGGDGGMPPPSDPCTVTTTGQTDTTKNPCQQVAQLNALAVNDSIAKQNKLLAGYLATSNLEHGFDQNLQNWNTGINSSYLSAPLLIASSTTPNQLNPPFTWNSTNGYTISFTHDHPNGSGPSPEDIFYMLQNSQNSALTSAGQQAVAFYKANSSVTVVTSTNNYVVTVSDWSALQTLYNTYLANPTTFDNTVISNSNASNYEAAILTAFAGAITLYTNGGTANYYPLTVTSSKNVVSEVLCPQN